MDARDKAAAARDAYAPTAQRYRGASAAHVLKRAAAFYNPGAAIGERNDCTVRALHLLTRLSYAEAHAVMAKHGRKPGQGVAGTATVYKRYGARVVEGTYGCTLAVAMARHSRGFFAVFTHGHVFAMIDGKLIDSFADGARKRVRYVMQFPDPTNGA